VNKRTRNMMHFLPDRGFVATGPQSSAAQIEIVIALDEPGPLSVS
jgi:hypothetical protein